MYSLYGSESLCNCKQAIKLCCYRQLNAVEQILNSRLRFIFQHMSLKAQILYSDQFF